MTLSANGSKGKNDGDAIVPIWRRPSDLLYVLWYFNFFFSVTFTDIHNFTASFMGLEVHELENRVNMVWPPRVLTDLYFKWARTVDPLLYENPMWWQVMEWINLLTLMPYSFLAMYGFIRGSNWLRMPGIITNSWTWYSLMLCIFATLYGHNRTQDVPMFLAIYVPFLVFPMCLVWRFWQDKPFSQSTMYNRSGLQRFVDFIVVVSMIVTFGVYFYYIQIWIRTHTPFLDEVLGHLPAAATQAAAAATGVKVDL